MAHTASTDAATTIAQVDSRFNDQFGDMSPRSKDKVKGEMSEFVQAFIAASPFVVMATADPDGNCDASPKGGKPGFVKVIDRGRLLLPDVAGNRLFQSYQNMDDNPHVGLLFMIPGLNDTVRINGTVSIVDREELEHQRVELSPESGIVPLLDRRQLQAPAGRHHQRGRVLHPLPAGLQLRQVVGHRADCGEPDPAAHSARLVGCCFHDSGGARLLQFGQGIFSSCQLFGGVEPHQTLSLWLPPLYSCISARLRFASKPQAQ